MTTAPHLLVEQALDLINHYSRRARSAAGDEGRGYRPLPEVVGEVAAEVPGAGVEDLHVLADEAYEVFARADAGEDVAPAVNALLAPAAPTPRLGADGAVVWEVADDQAALRAALAITLLDWVHVRGAERLGLCNGIRCADAFADASPAGRKKYCSTGCLNRHKVSEHRRRAAAGA
ncbi:CGNR zinc finger domain-containing protein [Georgenia sp. TF02-10]|uniref:CGNR zinc finger domain-containing protein n=1 Tax=Georgenia sp. TF02-10 TaxID=2917725 RepID=UPI001FA6D560|nr:CGNR zinc finger domain-containing protein [Georgenia sp. TF02-10]UNX53787.1 CGNR zinc finger domain-containing protein [Georgenia sp. TF02-10]